MDAILQLDPQIEVRALQWFLELPAPRGDRGVSPSPATHAILLQLKAGECVRHSI